MDKALISLDKTPPKLGGGGVGPFRWFFTAYPELIVSLS